MPENDPRGPSLLRALYPVWKESMDAGKPRGDVVADLRAELARLLVVGPADPPHPLLWLPSRDGFAPPLYPSQSTDPHDTTSQDRRDERQQGDTDHVRSE